MSTCALAAAGCFLARSGKTAADWLRLLLRISVLGALCYLMLFEARSRYLIMATPLYFMLAADGATLLYARVQTILAVDKTKKIGANTP